MWHEADVFKQYERCHPFSISNEVKNSIEKSIGSLLESRFDGGIIERLSFPFEALSLEVDKDRLLSIFRKDDRQEHTLTILHVMCTAYHHGFFFTALCTVHEKGKSNTSAPFYISDFLHYEISKKIPGDISFAIYSFLKSFFSAQRRECIWANEKISYKARIDSGKNRRLVRIKNYVQVILKSERIKYETNAGRTIEWSHRWEVMGHWRRVQGLGKDSHGLYTVNGFTWVREHEKGPVEKDLIVKARHIIDDRHEARH